MTALLPTGNRDFSNYQHHTPSNRKTFATNEKIKTGLGNMRNRPCYCGSHLKYKHCHLYKEQGYAKVTVDGRSHWEKAAAINRIAYNLGDTISGRKK